MKKLVFDNNAIQTKEGKLILDSHKLSYHYDRVEKWENNERVPPVSVDMALTRACGAMCSFCYAMVQEPQERSTIKTKEDILVFFIMSSSKKHQKGGANKTLKELLLKVM